MTTSLMPEARQRYYTNVGLPAAGCKLFTYAAGTSTPKATYQDAAGTVPHANPITLNSKGEAVIYWSGAYKVDLKTAAGAQITGYPVDNVTSYDTLIAASDALLRADLAALTGALLVGFTPTASTAATNVQAAIVEIVTDLALPASGAGGVGTTKPFGTASTVKADLAITYPAARKSLADVIAKIHGGAATTIACYGDSLTYGQDTSVNGQVSPLNGSTALRSRYPYPETLQDALALNSFTVSATVINRGYPGDTAAMGLGRWAAASATDLAILMYGTNDGKTLAVTVDEFKKRMAEMIEREFAKNAVVILLSPPLVNDAPTNANISAYTVALHQLADEYNVLLIDAKEQLSGLTNIWSEATDLVHLNSYAYAELGWHLSGLLINRDRATRSITAGSIYYPCDEVGYGGTLTINALAKGGSFTAIAPGARYIVCAYFDDDVLPVIHSYNTSGTNVDLLVQYAGNGIYRGLTAPELVHVAAVSTRQSLTANELRRGYRTLLLTNNGAQTAYIEAIEFAELSHVATSQGMLKKSVALSGAYQSVRQTAAIGTFWTAIDNALPLTAPYVYSAYVTITDLAGIAVFKNRAGQTLLSDILLARRVGNDLVLREIVAGAVTDTTAGGVGAFAAGTFTGEISIELATAAVNVYLNGVLKITKATPSNTYGFPGLMSASAAAMIVCQGAQVQGYVKGPYGVTP